MKLGSSAFAAALLLAGATGAAHATDRDDSTVHARLSGFQEVPSVASVAGGRFKARIDEAAGTIFWELDYSGLQADVLQAHIHFGQRHTNGGITVFLCTNLGNGPAGTPPCPARTANLNGTIAAANVLASPPAQQLPAGGFAQLVRAMRAGATYVNVHSAASPGGEIRGQIRAGRGRGHDDD
jgi:CHRD domain